MKRKLFTIIIGVVLLLTGISYADSGATVNFWMPGQEPTIKSTMEGILAQFQKENPNIKVNYTQIPWNEYFVKLNTAYSGGVAPDVLGLGWGQFGQLISQNKFLAFDKNSVKLNTKDLYDVALKEGSYRGKLYGLLLPEVRVFLYRKDYFKEAGLNPNKPPRNWKELQQYAIKLTKRNGNRVERAGLDVATANGQQMFSTMLWQLGGDLWDEDGQPLFNTKDGVKALTYLVDLKNKYNTVIPSDVQSLTGPVFMNGYAAMAYMQTQALPQLEEKAGDKLGYALPTKEKTNTALIAGTFLAVSATTKEKEAAVKLAEFLYSPNAMWDIYKGINFLPTRKSLEARFIKDSPEKNKIFSAALKNSRGFNKSPVFTEANKTISLALEQAYYGRKTPKEALDDAAAKIRALLKK
jgi:ABC-type glycerol-3-phosphate transport system substrate-binding protein